MKSERVCGLRCYEPVCPTEAIFCEDDLPDDWAWYKAVADDYFAEVGDFGGSSWGAGPIDHDHELVAQLPSDVNTEVSGTGIHRCSKSETNESFPKRLRISSSVFRFL